MQITRRRLLQSGSIAAVGSIAGCLGGDTSGQGETLPAPVNGAADASVTVHCKQFSLQVLPAIESAYVEPGSIKYVRHDYPFVDPDWSWKTANAARAVQDTQGDAVFFEYVDLLYEHFDSYSLELFASLAETVGADPQVIRNAAANDRYRSTLETDLALGNEKGVTGTPTIFVNGEQAPSPSYEDVSATIEAHL